MINIQTVYPCPRCKQDIPPRVGDQNRFCSHCGTEQQDIDTRTLWNIFTCRKGENKFHMRYGGSPILSFEDVEELAFEAGHSEHYDMYVASYSGTALGNMKELNSDDCELVVNTWQKRGFRGIEPNQGGRTIVVTSLERK